MNGYKNYKQKSIYSMSGAEQLLLLFDETIKRLTRAEQSLKEKNYSDFRKFNFLFLWIVGWCTVCLLCLYQPFMVFWVGSGAMFEMNTVILFSMYFLH